jgi:hypothetical protein
MTQVLNVIFGGIDGNVGKGLVLATFRVFNKLHQRLPSGIKQLCLPFVRKASNTIRKNLNLIYPSVFIFEGLEKDSGEPFTFAYSGFYDLDAEYWGQAILLQGHKRRLLGRMPIWRVASILETSCPDCGLALIEHPSWAMSLLPRGGFRIPHWVNMSLDLSKPIEHLFGNQRTFLKGKIKKNNLSYKMANDLKSFDDFYNNMFLPYIQQRHGSLALLDSYKDLLDIFQKGELIFVLKGEEAISAGLIEFSKGQVRFRRLGVRGAKLEYVKLGAIGAMYYFLAMEMIKRGYRRMNVGGTRPLLSDGVTRFKSFLRTEVLMGNEHSCLWTWFLKDSTALRRFLVNNPFIFMDQKGKPCGAFFFETDPKSSTEALEGIARKWGFEGLHQRRLFNFDKFNRSNPHSVALEPIKSMAA